MQMQMKAENCHFIYGEQEINPIPEGWRNNIRDFSRLNEQKFSTNLVTLKTCGGQFEDLFRASKILWAQVMRFKTVLDLGGLYSDCDIQYYGPIPDVSECEHVFATEIHGHVSDAFFYAKPGSHIMKKAFDLSLQWCKEVLQSSVKTVSVFDFLEGAGVGMFNRLVKSETGLDFVSNNQIHMSETDFAGKFHPENGVGIVPFEALCRHSRFNWIGWHQCNGTWRPRNDQGADMSPEALIQFNPS